MRYSAPLSFLFSLLFLINVHVAPAHSLSLPNFSLDSLNLVSYLKRSYDHAGLRKTYKYEPYTMTVVQQGRTKTITVTYTTIVWGPAPTANPIPAPPINNPKPAPCPAQQTKTVTQNVTRTVTTTKRRYKVYRTVTVTTTKRRYKVYRTVTVTRTIQEWNSIYNVATVTLCPGQRPN